MLGSHRSEPAFFWQDWGRLGQALCYRADVCGPPETTAFYLWYACGCASVGWLPTQSQNPLGRSWERYWSLGLILGLLNSSSLSSLLLLQLHKWTNWGSKKLSHVITEQSITNKDWVNTTVSNVKCVILTAMGESFQMKNTSNPHPVAPRREN